MTDIAKLIFDQAAADNRAFAAGVKAASTSPSSKLQVLQTFYILNDEEGITRAVHSNRDAALSDSVSYKNEDPETKGYVCWVAEMRDGRSYAVNEDENFDMDLEQMIHDLIEASATQCRHEQEHEDSFRQPSM